MSNPKSCSPPPDICDLWSIRSGKKSVVYIAFLTFLSCIFEEHKHLWSHIARVQWRYIAYCKTISYEYVFTSSLGEILSFFPQNLWESPTCVSAQYFFCRMPRLYFFLPSPSVRWASSPLTSNCPSKTAGYFWGRTNEKPGWEAEKHNSLEIFSLICLCTFNSHFQSFYI